jgi:cobalt-zinc-cadmium efflux system outer membrane protein
MKICYLSLLLSTGAALAEEATLPAIWQAVQARHPAARVAEASWLAAEGDWHQARIWNNPELSFEGENLGGDFSGTDTAEWTLSLSQLIEWPGRRSRRIQSARLDRADGEWESKSMMRNLAIDVSRSFYETLALQEKMKLNLDAVEQAKAFVRMAELRVKVGKSTVLESNKAQVELARHELQREANERELSSALEHIGRMTGRASPPGALIGVLHDTPAPPDRAAVTEALKATAAYAFKQAEVKRRKLALLDASRAWIPDLVLAAGFRQNDADETRSYLGQVGLEFPLWNRGKGQQLAATARLHRAESEQALMDQELQTEAMKRSAHLRLQWRTIQRYQDEILPLLSKHAEQAERSYREGWSGYLEYLEARRDYREQKASHIDTLKDYHIEYLSIHPLRETNDEN